VKRASPTEFLDPQSKARAARLVVQIFKIKKWWRAGT